MPSLHPPAMASRSARAARGARPLAVRSPLTSDSSRARAAPASGAARVVVVVGATVDVVVGAGVVPHETTNTSPQSSACAVPALAIAPIAASAPAAATRRHHVGPAPLALPTADLPVP